MVLSISYIQLIALSSISINIIYSNWEVLSSIIFMQITDYYQ
jgi:hypothetical protein